MPLVSVHLHACYHTLSDSFTMMSKVTYGDYVADPEVHEELHSKAFEILALDHTDPAAITRGMLSEAITVWLKRIHSTVPF